MKNRYFVSRGFRTAVLCLLLLAASFHAFAQMDSFDFLTGYGVQYHYVPRTQIRKKYFLAVGCESPDRAAGRLDPHGVTTGIFERRFEQVAFLPVTTGSGRLGGVFDSGVVAQVMVQPAVGAIHDVVRAVFAHASFGLIEEHDFVGLVVVIAIGEAIKARPLGAVADDEEIVVDHA